MDSSDSSSSLRSLQRRPSAEALALHVFALLFFIPSITGRSSYTSIFSFGDSIADTGNLYFSSQPPISCHCFFPPNGLTYFRRPTGRCSDGRLIIDFIAESLGLPLVKPYLGIKNGQFSDWKIEEGANFAVVGSTALDADFFEEKGIHNVPTNDSLRIQFGWFKDLLPSLCNSSSSCKNILGKSLFLVGEIGGNDFNYPFALRKSLTEIKTYVAPVINAISSTISELIDIGAQTLMVPGNFPIGCNAFFLTFYQSENEKDYDEAGCLKWLNEFAEYYNEKLQSELNQLRGLHPHANIIFADYYNAALPLYLSPTSFGFTGLRACCGSGGPYNYNASALCGDPGALACEDPSKFISWDGLHLTEAAYRFIAKRLVIGQVAVPK
ncbi:GDSL esterase/lipase At1g31550-like [Neltuma alba]|uniref:GDSL esterase/lipase At1g31550-like n=1 Tax=Neltuma alba TaxID=207710 RepID=UPI0010A3287D|nr:GDSL esterase/lipase At1g31550-like [Prosopis alba]XP_028797290.1 GDSL esterase/lipase At1g31550-like [Prosopis alba]